MVNLFKESETERRWHQAKERSDGGRAVTEQCQQESSPSDRGNASYQEKTGSLKNSVGASGGPYGTSKISSSPTPGGFGAYM